MHECPVCHDSGDDVWMAWHSGYPWADRWIFAPGRRFLRWGLRHGFFDPKRMGK